MGRDNRQVVTTTEVKTGDITAKVNATGRVKPKAEVNIQAEIYEIIVEIPVEEGDTVEQGDLLVRLKQTSYQFSVDNARADLKTARAKLEQAESNLEYWEFKYELARDLFSKGSSSEEELIAVRDQYNSAQAAVETARQTVNKAEIALKQALDYYEKTEIESPIDGVVTDLNYEVGERTMIASPNVPGAIIMTVADMSVLEVEVRVDETDIKDLRIGQEAEITIDAFPDTSFAGVVTSIGASAQIAGQSFSEQVTDFLVKVQLLDKYKFFKPNLTAEVDIITGQVTSARYLPIQAIVAVDELPGEKDTSNSETEKLKTELFEGVYLYDNGTASFRQVELGIQDQTNIQIVSGLEVGAEVISGPYSALREISHGEAVRKREDR
jgi:HlyD family secretion protein